MKKFAGVPWLSITLVIALVMLFASLAALLLANSLRGQLEEAQGELQKMQDAQDRQQRPAKGGVGPTGREPSNLNKSQSQDSKSSTQEGQDQQQAIPLGMQGDGGSSLPYLLLLVVLASLVLLVMSALRLLFGGSRSGRAGSEASTLSHTETLNLGRESPLEDEGRWIKLVEECVDVVDDLDEHMDSFDAPRREVAGHVILHLEEILGRSGVEIISNDAIFDRARHRPDADHAATDNDAAVRETLSPGFAVGHRVLRRARVRLE